MQIGGLHVPASQTLPEGHSELDEQQSLSVEGVHPGSQMPLLLMHTGGLHVPDWQTSPEGQSELTEQQSLSFAAVQPGSHVPLLLMHTGGRMHVLLVQTIPEGHWASIVQQEEFWAQLPELHVKHSPHCEFEVHPPPPPPPQFPQSVEQDEQLSPDSQKPFPHTGPVAL